MQRRSIDRREDSSETESEADHAVGIVHLTLFEFVKKFPAGPEWKIITP